MTDIVNQKLIPDPDLQDIQHTHIEPSQGWVALQLKELWRFRELLYYLTWRDIKVRYKQTILGVLWAIIQPVVSMVIFNLIFGRVARLGPEGIPYAPWNFAGLVPWLLFAGSLSATAGSLVGSSHLITKVYFPRLVIPISSTLSGVVDFGIQLLILFGMLFFFPVQPTLTGMLLLPGFVLLALITALGVGLWLSALNVQYRDIRYIVPFLVQIWFYATPIVYTSQKLEEPWRTLIGLNPMAGVTEGFRWALIGTDPPGTMIFISVAVSVLILVTGAFYFRRMEKNFADVI